MKSNREIIAAILRWIIVLIFRLSVATLSAIAVAICVIPAGIAERGYDAVGGEHLLVISAWILGFWASSAFFRRKSK
jgi:hypothetical protein